MNYEKIMSFLKSDTTSVTFCSYEEVELDFVDIKPCEYISFMEEDLKNNDERSRVNALSNAKRSLDCQIEVLLYTFCLKSYAEKKRMNIPSKLELLKKIGIIAPRILSKINKVRNTMEHDFYCPSYEEVQDFADVILLFNSYTDKYLHYVKSDCEIIDYQNNDFWVVSEFDRENQLIKIDIRFHSKDVENENLNIEASDEIIDSFCEFLTEYNRLTSMF